MKIITELNDRQLKRMIKRAADLYESALDKAASIGCTGVKCPHCDDRDRARKLIQQLTSKK